MKDEHGVEFLQWCLPRLGFRWKGFRKVRGQVCKRIGRRMQELGLSDLSVYRAHLERHPAEWEVLDALCRVTISRFYRGRKLFDTLCTEVLPAQALGAIAQGEPALRCWSIGSCSGEEPYTLQILWKLSVVPNLPVALPLQVLATEIDPGLIGRARRARYPASSLKDLPGVLKRQAFVSTQNGYVIQPPFIENVHFEKQDIRKRLPSGRFHLILCRNLVFTYFDAEVQRSLLRALVGKLLPEGVFIIGAHESLPSGDCVLVPYDETLKIYRTPDAKRTD
jgi:chemotaxis protein methyltransferase CheR